jgi:hypothetical protein
MPREVNGSVRTQKIWVSADAAVDANGQLDESRLGASSVAFLRGEQPAVADIRSQSSGDSTGAVSCPAALFDFAVVEHYRANSTLHDLVAEASDIIDGRITEIQEGFFKGTPGSLLRVTTETVYRESGTIRKEGGDVFLAYPYATLKIGGAMYCTRGAAAPAIGDRVLIFSYVPGRGEMADIIEADGAREVIIAREGRVLPPQRPSAVLSDPAIAGRPFDAVVGIVRKLVNGSKPSRGSDAP